jgi:DNA polymerase kappa
MTAEGPAGEKIVNEHDTLKYSLLGPSLTKSGQDNVDQSKVRSTEQRFSGCIFM